MPVLVAITQRDRGEPSPLRQFVPLVVAVREDEGLTAQRAHEALLISEITRIVAAFYECCHVRHPASLSERHVHQKVYRYWASAYGTL